MIKKILLLLFLIIVVVLLLKTEIGVFLRKGNIDEVIRLLKSYGGLTLAVIFSLIVVQAIVPYVPFILLATTSVLLYGIWQGFLINLLAVSLGCFFSLLISRYLAKDWARSIVKNNAFYQKMLDYQGNSFFCPIIFFSRLIPLIPCSVINIAAGLTNIRLVGFLSATLLGNLPIIFLESLFGYYLVNNPKNKWEMLLLLVLIIPPAIFYYKKYLAQKKPAS